MRRTTRRATQRRPGFESLEQRQLLTAANLLVTEFMATNDAYLLDGDGADSDWIEIHNADTTPVDLTDYFLSDNADRPDKWALPAVTLPAGEYLVVFASAPLDANGQVLDNYVDGAGGRHANFKLDSAGEDLLLVYQDPSTLALSVVHEYAGGFPEQFPNTSYGVATDGASRYFDAPTPGASNGAGLLGVVEDTRFSVDRGFYDAPFEVAITTDTPSAAIYYTTDGSTPTPTNGGLYNGPLTIDHTTVLRAVATKQDYHPTNVDTQTYLFLRDIVGQTDQTALDAGYPSVWRADNGDYDGDYGFDADVVGAFDANGAPLGGDLFGGVYAAQLQQSLLAAPTLSIVMDPDDLFGQEPGGVEGIYIDPRQDRNPEPERATSIEWITPDGSAELQVDAGIQMQGGAFRSHFLTRKHSFRLVFKDNYGPSELGFPLFGDAAAQTFNTVVLKATANDGYSWGPSQQSLQYARDQFGHSLQLAMGHASPHDTYAHLYINGIYWGLYSAAERPDAEFAASYLGVNPGNWDAIHDNEANSGDFAAWSAMLDKSFQAGFSLVDYMELQGKNLDGSPSANDAPLLDVENYVDYLLINAWAGNDDWPHHNFWAGRDRSPDTTEGFQFFLWDFDGVMGNSRKWSPLDTKTFNQSFSGFNNVGQAHNYLKFSDEYRLRFADRAHRYFFNEGLLTPDSLVARYAAIAAQVETPLVAESARWGDLHSEVPLTPAEWATERDWLLNSYLPQRSAIVMDELREFGLYPEIAAPSFNQHGGEIGSGFELSIAAPTGVVYYTLDGGDPRLVGGALNTVSASVYTGAPIPLTEGATVRARVYSGGEWSALNEAEFAIPTDYGVSGLRITELQYHPADAPGVADDEDLEYLELLNTGAASASLNGVSIAGFASTPYVFDDGLALAPGERIVVARTPSEFQAVYGAGINLAPSGYFDRNLSNGGELVELLGPQGEVLQSFTYDDVAPWPTAPDGAGPSLEIIGPLGEASDPANWRASLYAMGSPGVAGLPIPGDYDASGAVDQEDYAVWRSSYGAVTPPGNGADGDGDGLVTAADYTVWRDNLGQTTTLYGPGSIAPEAASVSLESPSPAPRSTGAALNALQLAFATIAPPPTPTNPGALPTPNEAIESSASFDRALLLLLDAPASGAGRPHSGLDIPPAEHEPADPTTDQPVTRPLRSMVVPTAPRSR